MGWNLLAIFEVEGVEVQGYCPVYDIGNKFVIDGARLVMDKDGAFCHFALMSLKRKTPILEDNFEIELQIRCMEKCVEASTGGIVVFGCKKLEDATV